MIHVRASGPLGRCDLEQSDLFWPSLCYARPVVGIRQEGGRDMVQVNSGWQVFLFFAFVIAWIGVTGVLFYRFNLKAAPYLRRFPPVADSSLDTPWWFGTPPRAFRQARRQALWQQQSDPELEQLRRPVVRHGVSAYLWWLGFPFLVAGALVLLAATGIVTFA
jgi:hypothetical protein